MRLDWAFATVFGIAVRLDAPTADLYCVRMDTALRTDAFRRRELFGRVVIATIESPLDHHAAIRGRGGPVVTMYPPDPVVDPGTPGFADNVRRFGAGEDVSDRARYLTAHPFHRAGFRTAGETATADLSPDDPAGLTTETAGFDIAVRFGGDTRALARDLAKQAYRL